MVSVRSMPYWALGPVTPGSKGLGLSGAFGGNSGEAAWAWIEKPTGPRDPFSFLPKREEEVKKKRYRRRHTGRLARHPAVTRWFVHLESLSLG